MKLYHGSNMEIDKPDLSRSKPFKDIVIGPIADDGGTYQLRRYSMGDISMSRLIEELKYANGLTIQYYFGTEHALSYLKKL